ncbi:MAG TPA: hypothetical protein DCW31_06445, partial [Lactobacillus sp.]|nr:hypothetical protein [Lactobacillus sp.]
MALNQHELFNKLLEQLNLEDQANQAAFTDAKITDMTVHEKSRTWSFAFHFTHILPFETFMNFSQRLNQAFSEIASVDFRIDSDDTEADISTIARYWTWAVSHSGLNEQFARQLCEGSTPTMDGERVII